MTKGIVVAAALTLAAAPAYAQFGGIDKLKKGADMAKKADDLHFSDEEEQELGKSVSEVSVADLLEAGPEFDLKVCTAGQRAQGRC